MHKLEKDLTGGNIVKQMISFALPFLLSHIIQSLYNLADTLIVGLYRGPIGISGVSIGGQVTLLITNVVIGLSVGGTVIIGQYMGAGRRDMAQKTIGTLLSSLLVAAVVITGAMLLLTTPILRLIQTPPESFSEARSYLSITVLGSVFIFAYNALSAVMRGMGDSRTPMIFVLISCVINVGLDFLTVGALSMGAAGAALATIVSQAFSVALCVAYLKKRDFLFDFRLRSFVFDKAQFKLLMKVGVPTSIQNVVVNLSFLVLTAIVNSIGGYMASAAVGIVGRFNGFAIMPSLAIGSSVSAVSAQNLGAGYIKRAKQACYTGIIMAFLISLPIYAVAQLLPAEILRLFDDSPQMIRDGVTYMRAFSLDYLIVPFTFCLSGLIAGSGHTVFSSFSSVLSSLGFRIPAAFILGVTMDLQLVGIGYAVPISTLGAALISLIYLLTGKWKTSTVLKRPREVLSEL